MSDKLPKGWKLRRVGEISNSSLILSWPSFFDTLALQENFDLVNSNAWATVNYPLMTNGAIKSVTVPITTNKAFYRLLGN